jgi:hypothetical protein
MSFVGQVSLTDLTGAEKLIGDLAARAVRAAVRKALRPTEAEVGLLVSKAIEASPEWDSLVNGRLRQEFGLEFPDQQVGKVRDAVAGAVAAREEDFPGAIAGMVVEVLPLEFERQLARESAYQSRGGLVDWLSWLLFAGSAVVVSDASLQLFRDEVKASRAGKALMRRFKNRPLGYSVGEFRGTSQDNWFDRVLEPLGGPVFDVMLRNVTRNF